MEDTSNRARQRRAMELPPASATTQAAVVETRRPGHDFPYDATLEANGQRSLANIGLQAFWIGVALGTSIVLGVLCAAHAYLIWRLFAFSACLSVFHFLEYWTTARFNTSVVQANSFLLFTNGAAYNVAYTLAILEIVICSLVTPSYGRLWSSCTSRAIGLLLVVIGQGVRSLAMSQAGRNFNHTPQQIRKDSHMLVTTGIYAWLRHPSYFGFFWWAIGTQILVGNKICVLGYVIVLWNFFNRRIRGEEHTLIGFFAGDYVQYRAKTSVGIPFIR